MSDALNKINQRIKDLATKVEESISFDDDGAATLPETFLADNLIEGVDLDTVKRVQDEEANFAAGLALGLGNATLPLMQKKKDLERTSAHLGFGHNTIKASIDRKIMTRAPGSTEEKEKWGNVAVKLESGATAKRGDLKRVNLGIAENYASTFGGK